MSLNSFIFSQGRSDRIKRHVLFWIAWYVYFAILHAANPHGKPEISYFRNPVFTFAESFFQVLPQIPLVYAMLYIVLPRFILKKKYVLAVISTIFFWFLGGVIHLYWYMDVIPFLMPRILPAQFIENTQRPESVNFFIGMMATYKGAFTISAFALLFKIGKDWYLKAQRNLQLQKENTTAQMQLLTAQIHPHFLFNTLNNIFSQSQLESPKGSKMIMDLSDILRYVLYEGQKPLVPLKQELQMLTEYISLEKIRYGNKLEVHVLTPDKPDDLYIAPLLLLPFVENCFKHGASNMLENPWINLTVEIKGTTLVMKLMNGKDPMKENSPGKKGIGISNVRQRLELLNKDKYDLQLREDDEVFVVDLRVELIKIESKEQADSLAQINSEMTYA
jgi:signal transduction histidine kinase